MENRRSVGGSAPAAGGLRPQPPELLLPLPVTVIFLKVFVAQSSLLSKRNKKNLEIAIMFCFCYSFLTSNSVQGTLIANVTGSDFSAS